MSKASNNQAAAKQQARVNPPTKGTPMYGCGKYFLGIQDRQSILSLGTGTPLTPAAEHTQMLLTQPQENINTCINNYKSILRRIFDDVSQTIPQTARNGSGQVVTTITSNYLCLQCPDIVTEDGIPQHGDKKAHRFCKNTL